MKFVVATEISTLIWWWRASLLASPTVFPASIVPWRWMAPVRARIASSSVVLPLWNGPTSAMHRGPVALVPFCAISASQSTAMRSSARPFAPSFQDGGGLGKRRRRPAHDGGTRMDMRSLHADENGRLDGGRSCIARSSQASGAGAQMQLRHAEGQIEPDRGGHRDRLQRDRVVGTADENVGAEAGGDRHLAARAEIIAGEKGGAGGRDAVRAHRPYQHAAAGGADVEPELAERPAVDLLRAGRLRRERAHDRLLRADDEADAGRDVAGQHTGSHALGGGWIGGRNDQCKRDCPDGMTQHMDPPLFDRPNPIGVAPHQSILRKIARVMSSCRRSAGCAGKLPPRPRSWWRRKCGTRDRNRTAYPAPPPRPRPPAAR